MCTVMWCAVLVSLTFKQCHKSCCGQHLRLSRCVMLATCYMLFLLSECTLPDACCAHKRTLSVSLRLHGSVRHARVSVPSHKYMAADHRGSGGTVVMQRSPSTQRTSRQPVDACEQKWMLVRLFVLWSNWRVYLFCVHLCCVCMLCMRPMLTHASVATRTSGYHLYSECSRPFVPFAAVSRHHHSQPSCRRHLCFSF